MNFKSTKIDVPELLIERLGLYLETHNLANRGKNDGSKHEQLVGLIGECTVIKYLTGSYPNYRDKPDGFDGGYDIIINGNKIDVKCMGRNSYVKPHYVNNFYVIQQDHDSDTLVFTSYHKKNRVLEICGWITKDQLKERAVFYAAGSERSRADGSTFKLRGDNYEVRNDQLEDINKL